MCANVTFDAGLIEAIDAEAERRDSHALPFLASAVREKIDMALIAQTVGVISFGNALLPMKRRTEARSLLCRSTAGSRKGWARRFYKMPRRCSTSWRDFD